MGLFDFLKGKKKDKPEDLASVPQQEPEAEEEEEWEEQGVPQELQPKEVQEMLESDEPPVLVDVREPHELEADGKIPGAVHIPMGELDERLGELDKDRYHVVYCASGMRSFDAGFKLIESGFGQVGNLNGGIKAWDGDIEK